MQVPFNELGRSVASESGALLAACERVVASGRYILGEEVVAFEREFAQFCGVPYAVGVGNGSDALELALRALGVAPGQRVATVANAAMYSTLAIEAIGALPRYVDVDETTLMMSPDALRRALDAPLAAIVVTHLYGRLAPMRELVALASARAVPVVEDCAQAHGATRDGVRAGAFGDAGCFSFYPTKNLGALGDGGAIVVRDPSLAAVLRSLRQYGWRDKYVVERSGGRNSRLDEMQAALLRTRLPRLEGQNARRREILAAYARGIQHPRIRPLFSESGPDHAAHLAVVRTPDRAGLRNHLAAVGVGSEVHYPLPDHHQVTASASSAEQSLPATERACAEVLSLPCFPALREAEIAAVIDACNRWQ